MTSSSSDSDSGVLVADSCSVVTTSSLAMFELAAESSTAPGPKDGWSLITCKRYQSWSMLFQQPPSRIQLLPLWILFLFLLFPEIHVHCLPLLHQPVNFVAHCLLREQVNALKLLEYERIESNGRNRFSLLHVIILPSSSSKMSAQTSISFLSTSSVHFTLGFLPPIPIALSFVRTCYWKNVAITAAAVVMSTSQLARVHIYSTKI